MAHLPDEIWLLIASYCDPQDAWLSLRRVNHQTQECCEHYFEDNVLPLAILVLPVTLPSYDMRNPVQGKVTFQPLEKGDVVVMTRATDRMRFRLTGTAPDYYHSHFLSRWASMRGANRGLLSKRMPWQLDLCGRTANAHLKNPFIDEYVGQEARLSFEWRATITSFYR